MAKTNKGKGKKISEIVLESKTVELATGITSEKLSSIFFDIASLKHQPEPMFRLDANNYRYYYRYEGEKPVFYTSVTTLIKNTLPTSPHLIKWLVAQGGDGKDIAEERANYGTFLHQECANILMFGKYDLDKVKLRLTEYILKNNIVQNEPWLEELKKDILSFAQFVIDYNIKPLAIELILWHPTDGYAGALDLVCDVDIEEKGYFGEVYASGANKGQAKESKRMNRVRAIIDIKSGRKGFYESHEVQLRAYKEMWNIHFPELPVTHTFNWSPKAWRTSPSYNFKDQTDSPSAVKLPNLVALARVEEAKRDNSITITKGIIDITKGLKDNIEELTFEDLIKRGK